MAVLPDELAVKWGEHPVCAAILLADRSRLQQQISWLLHHIDPLFLRRGSQPPVCLVSRRLVQC